MKTAVWTFLSAFALGLLVCGCGGEPEVSEFRADDQDAAVPAVPRAPEVKGDAKKEDKEEEEKDRQEDRQPEAETDPSRLFVIAEGEPNFEVVEDGNVFRADFPSAGTDSRHFVAALPPEALQTGGKPNAQLELPEGFAIERQAGYSEEGWPRRIRCQKDGALMALVPASISIQGTDEGPPEAQPELAVWLDPYYIDVTEVTLGQYERFRQSRQKTRSRALSLPVNASSPADHPALGIRLSDARQYARWAGKALPTEAEWEKAARGSEGFPHPWGYGPPAWHPPRTREQIDPVKTFRADLSPYGVYDLAGNAREWCEDWYSETAYRQVTERAETAVRNWHGPSRASIANHRVVKGNGPGWAAWHRASAHMAESAPDIGFRCVLRGNVPPDTGAAPRSHVPGKPGR